VARRPPSRSQRLPTPRLSLSRHTGALGVALAGLVLAGCGGGSSTPRADVGRSASPGRVEVTAKLVVRAGGVARRRVPSPAAAVSFDVAKPGRRPRHVEQVVHGGALTLRGPLEVKALIISSAADRGALLLHRLAELHSRLRPGQFPEGADLHNRLHIDSRGWTSGFWPGALWQAAAWVHGTGGAMFRSWALSATLAHFGQECSDSHDVGFMYGQSSLAGWRELCSARAVLRGRARLCSRLKRSFVAAADELRALAASNPGSGAIPTDAHSPGADTIIDSTMNIGILPWATRVTGRRAYAQLASHHAHVVASLLVRRDGSTAQSVHFDRRTGRVLKIHTHQGISASSTWSRGQAWAVYGFAQAAMELHDRGLVRVALRAARYVAAHLPAGGIPYWDYNAGGGAPVDVSAGVITAAGLVRLVDACRSLRGVCGGTGSWVALARRMLAASLGRARVTPPLGLLGSQVLNEHGRGCWCNGGELSFGLSYALEARRALGGA
jgi:unsaturated chondroitin disaccharide hydrolase